jgi:membrane protein YqaA with SNARE-associated domain
MKRNAAERDHRASLVVFSGLALTGVVAVGAGVATRDRAWWGIALGCLPTGVLGWILAWLLPRWMARRHPELAECKARELDERSEKVRHHAGYTALWIVFVYLGVCALARGLAMFAGVSALAWELSALYLLLAAYWGGVFYYGRKY